MVVAAVILEAIAATEQNMKLLGVPPPGEHRKYFARELISTLFAFGYTINGRSSCRTRYRYIILHFCTGQGSGMMKTIARRDNFESTLACRLAVQKMRAKEKLD